MGVAVWFSTADICVEVVRGVCFWYVGGFKGSGSFCSAFA